jgi:hypothetical protein
MSNQTGGRIPSFRKGDRLLADDLNKLAQAIIERLTGGNGVSVSSFLRSAVVTAEKIVVPPVELTQVEVQSQEDDYLKCRTLDASGNTGPNDIYVMKPWTLRRSPFDGQTVNGVSYAYASHWSRTADGEESQLITQDYFAGAVIYVMNMNISIEVETGIFTRMIDVNADARAWAVPPE